MFVERHGLGVGQARWASLERFRCVDAGAAILEILPAHLKSLIFRVL